MVKIMTFVGILLLVAAVFVTWLAMVDDWEDGYLDTNISQAEPLSDEFKEGYDFSDEINDSFSPIFQGFLQLGEDRGGGFFELVLEGAVALPIAIISFPQVMFTLLSIGVTLATNFFVDLQLGVGEIILGVAVIFIFVWGMMKLVTFWRRFEA